MRLPRKNGQPPDMNAILARSQRRVTKSQDEANAFNHKIKTIVPEEYFGPQQLLGNDIQQLKLRLEDGEQMAESGRLTELRKICESLDIREAQYEDLMMELQWWRDERAPVKRVCEITGICYLEKKFIDINNYEFIMKPPEESESVHENGRQFTSFKEARRVLKVLAAKFEDMEMTVDSLPTPKRPAPAETSSRPPKRHHADYSRNTRDNELPPREHPHRRQSRGSHRRDRGNRGDWNHRDDRGDWNNRGDRGDHRRDNRDNRGYSHRNKGWKDHRRHSRDRKDKLLSA